MRSLSAGFLFPLVAALLAAPNDAPPSDAQPSAEPAILLPSLPVPPAPPPVPATAVTLSGTQVYAFRVTGPCEAWAFPENLLSITQDAVGAGETLRLSDNFFDGTTTQKFKGPCTVFLVRPAAGAKGQAQLSIVAKAAPVTIKRVTFDVNGGQPPQPPPVPPAPVDPPTPVDPLLAAAQTAYTADTSATKAADKTSLAAVYLAMADAVPSIGTAGGLLQVLTQSRTARIGDRLPTVRLVFNAKLQAMFPKGKTLTPEDKKAAADQFKAMAAVLQGVK